MSHIDNPKRMPVGTYIDVPPGVDETEAYNFTNTSATFVGIISSTADVSDRALITGGTISSGTIDQTAAYDFTSLGSIAMDATGKPADSISLTGGSNEFAYIEFSPASGQSGFYFYNYGPGRGVTIYSDPGSSAALNVHSGGTLGVRIYNAAGTAVWIYSPGRYALITDGKVEITGETNITNTSSSYAGVLVDVQAGLTAISNNATITFDRNFTSIPYVSLTVAKQAASTAVAVSVINTSTANFTVGLVGTASSAYWVACRR